MYHDCGARSTSRAYIVIRPRVKRFTGNWCRIWRSCSRFLFFVRISSLCSVLYLLPGTGQGNRDNSFIAPLFSKLVILLRGTIVNRTYVWYAQKPTRYIFSYFHQQYLVLITTVPLNSSWLLFTATLPVCWLRRIFGSSFCFPRYFQPFFSKFFFFLRLFFLLSFFIVTFFLFCFLFCFLFWLSLLRLPLMKKAATAEFMAAKRGRRGCSKPRLTCSVSRRPS